LAIDAQLPRSVLSLVVATAEVFVIEVNPIFLGDFLGDGFDELVSLVFTDQEGSGEGIELPCGCLLGGSFQPEAVAEAASELGFAKGASEELLQLVAVFYQQF